tara:strand:+ start:669 stop:965 length:297 start_codon:yes stop_codon:yes gene_type:complete
MELIFLLVTCFIISLLFIAPLTGTIAKAKGLKTFNWFTAGLFLGPIGLVAVSGMPDKNLQRALNNLISSNEIFLEEFIRLQNYKDSKEEESIEIAEER